VTGTELLDKIAAATPRYLAHCWNCYWANTTRQNDMHKFTDTELFIQTDFAAQIENSSQDNLTCTSRQHTNLDVFVVAHSPRLVEVPGAAGNYEKRVTTNDAWKVYAGASGKGKDADFHFHHIALKDLVNYYVTKRRKARLPPFTRIILWTDGAPGQYMCRQNLAKVASFWHKESIELSHRFAATSDFKGVHDSVGKEDRRWISVNVTADNIVVPQAYDLFCAVRNGRPNPAANWGESPAKLAKKGTLSFDNYVYRFINWEQTLDARAADDDDVIVENRLKKWDATTVEGCKSNREYRSGSQASPSDLRFRAQPCSCEYCRVGKYKDCNYKAWVCAKAGDDSGWARTAVIVKQPEGPNLSPEELRIGRRVIAEELDDKKARLETWASKIAVGDFLAFGAARSERDSQGVDFYLGKVVVVPVTHRGAALQIGRGRSRWNVKEGDVHLKVGWFKEVRSGVFQDENHEDIQLLEMAIRVAEDEKIILDPLIPGARPSRRALSRSCHSQSSRGALSESPAEFKLSDRSDELIHDENLTLFVDRAAPGSSA
jgi:hypothetical protein